SIPNVSLALGIVVAPIFARIARGATISVRDSRMIESSVLLGARPLHTLRKDILPLVLRPVLAYALVAVSMLVVAEASLSYLGLGVPRPDPTLGNMISAGQDQIDRAPHVVFAPATVLFLIILALNVLGEHVQERLR